MTNAQGYCTSAQQDYVMVDIPGTYSLMAHSAEEEVARNFICFGRPDAVVVVCDATCLERNLNLVLQTIEICPNVVVCVNLMDEAERKGISLDLPLLSRRLGVPVVGTTARKRHALRPLLATLDCVVSHQRQITPTPIFYGEGLESALATLTPLLIPLCGEDLNPRWLALQLLNQDATLLQEVEGYLGFDILSQPQVAEAHALAQAQLLALGRGGEHLKDHMVATLVNRAENLCRGVVSYRNKGYHSLDRKLDRVLTSKLTGYPVMLLLLALTFWLTITGANYPSQLLAEGLFWVQDRLSEFFVYINAPSWLHGALVLGVYRVLAWVVSVMLPPMAIFFPLFTLLEDAGYLPRVAYNLDKPFQKCCACGKQALCMTMGFGCNAAGVIGCRIIDSPRERLLAILTNNFVPCNGRLAPPHKGGNVHWPTLTPPPVASKRLSQSKRNEHRGRRLL